MEKSSFKSFFCVGEMEQKNERNIIMKTQTLSNFLGNSIQCTIDHFLNGIERFKFHFETPWYQFPKDCSSMLLKNIYEEFYNSFLTMSW